MNDSYFLSLIIESLSVSPFYTDENDSLFDISMLRLLFEKLEVEKFMAEYDLSKADYEQYFKEIISDVDLSLKSELENSFE